MILVALALVALLVVCGLVTAYVAYVDRGEDIPHAPRLTGAMTKARHRVDAFVGPGDADAHGHDERHSDTAA